MRAEVGHSGVEDRGVEPAPVGCLTEDTFDFVGLGKVGRDRVYAGAAGGFDVAAQRLEPFLLLTQ
jgi:hypothetical protein